MKLNKEHEKLISHKRLCDDERKQLLSVLSNIIDSPYFEKDKYILSRLKDDIENVLLIKDSLIPSFTYRK